MQEEDLEDIKYTNDFQTLSFEQRGTLIREIQSTQQTRGEALPLNQISILCQNSVKSKSIEQKTHLTDLVICHLDQIKHQLLVQVKVVDQGVSELASQLVQLLTDHQNEMLNFQNQNLDSMLDLVLVSEFLSLCYLSNHTREIPTITETLMQKMDRLTLSQEFNQLNGQLKLYTRRESGIFESIANLLRDALASDSSNAEQLATLTESVALKLMSSPLNVHTSSLCKILQALLHNTFAEYHLELVKELFKMSEALFKELRRGGQEPFKKKLIYKLNDCIGLICLQGTCTQWIIQQYKELLNSNKQELAYLLFTAVDGQWFKGAEKEIELTIEWLLKKIIDYIQENQGKQEKQSVMKQFVLFLKPLEELIQAVGMKDKWREKLKECLQGLAPIFPTAMVGKCLPPNSLLESYFQISLLADDFFCKNGKVRYDTYSRLFYVIKNQLGKQDSNALVMAKLIKLTNSIDEIPSTERLSFFEEFGAVVKQLLQIKEFHVFYMVLSAFMEWAKETELTDLNFMVPQEDTTVTDFLQNYMQNNKINLDSAQAFQQCLDNMYGRVLAHGLKDAEIMDKFCTPTSFPLSENQQVQKPIQKREVQQVRQVIDVPALAKKLVEVEYMMLGKDMPAGAEVILYSKFKAEQPNAKEKEFKGFLSEISDNDQLP